MAPEPSISVLIIDAKGIFRAGLCSLLHTIPLGKFMITTSDAPDFTSQTQGFIPDLLIADYLFIKDHVNVIAELDNKNALVLFDPHRGDDLHILKNDFTNFLNKSCEEKDLVNAINSVLTNKTYKCDIASKIINTPTTRTGRLSVLSDRELEITLLITEGLATKSIAETLNLSPHTIQSHRKNILKKLGVHSAIELAKLTKK